MRLDMPLLDEDFVMGNEENDVTEPADTGDINTNILGSDNEVRCVDNRFSFLILKNPG